MAVALYEAFFDQGGIYYQVTKPIPTPEGHTPAPVKPSRWATWDAVNGEWVDNGPPVKTAEDLEAEVQAIADTLMQNSERDMAIALATVDLAIATRDGQIDGLTQAQVRTAFRDRVVFYLRQRRGI